MTIRTTDARAEPSAVASARVDLVATDRVPAHSSIAPTVAVNVIAVVAVFCVLLPIAGAVLLSLMLSPPVRFFERLGVARAVASALVVLSVVAFLMAGLFALAGPAKTWIERAPQIVQQIQQKLRGLTKPFDDIKKATDQLQEQTRAGETSGPREVRVVRPALIDTVLLGSPQVISAALSVLVLLYFLLASGDVFLRKLVSVIPTFQDKKRAVDITRQIETDISFYLLSFASVNVGLGVAMTVVTASLGMPNPSLWGVVVAILNFVPYVGALTSMAVLGLVGVQSFDSLPMAAVAPVILLVLVALTAEVITPMVLGRGLLLNPVAIFIAIMLWGWLWGIAGVLLAVPLLASFKIICERVEPLHGVAEFLTT
jgi:predicted PurR-regulated permease PerM